MIAHNLLTDRPGDYPFLWAWLAKRTGLPWSSDMRTMGLTDDTGKILSVAAFCSFMHGKQCFIHFAADTAISRRFLKHIFTYLFLDAKLTSVLGLFDAANHNIHTFVERVGFDFKCALEGSLLYEMTPDKCRWINHGQEEQAASAS